jgi:hypothetical protein
LKLDIRQKIRMFNMKPVTGPNGRSELMHGVPNRTRCI